MDKHKTACLQPAVMQLFACGVAALAPLGYLYHNRGTLKGEGSKVVISVRFRLDPKPLYPIGFETS